MGKSGIGTGQYTVKNKVYKNLFKSNSTVKLAHLSSTYLIQSLFIKVVIISSLRTRSKNMW